MSHFISVNTKVTNKSLLLAALRRMNLPIESHTDTKVTMEERFYFEKESAAWAVKGDPYYCKSRKLRDFYNHEDEFVRQINVAYAAEEAMLNAQLQGLTLIEEQQVGQSLVLTFEG